MPITVGAIRKQRADKRKALLNLKTKSKFKRAITLSRKKPTQKNLSRVFSELDRATKKHIIHKNKAARLKSRLTKLV